MILFEKYFCNSFTYSERRGHFRKRIEEQKSPQERISMILEKESELTALQLNAASYIREIRILKEQNK